MTQEWIAWLQWRVDEGITHLDERVKLLISTDSKLQMPWCDTLHLYGSKSLRSGVLLGTLIGNNSMLVA